MLGSASVKPRAIRTPRVRLGAVVALALAAGFLVWLLTRPGTDSEVPQQASASPAPAPSAAPSGPRTVTENTLTAVASSIGHPLFWAGPMAGVRYELTQSGDRAFVRYLPAGVKVGDGHGYLTIGTYAVANAWNRVRASARRPGAVTLHLKDGSIAVYNRDRPTNVYLASRDLSFQVEIYDPDPAAARRLALSGIVRPIGTRAVSTGALRALGRRTPLYWVGAKTGMRYELTEATGSRLFVRYLPPGAKVGDPRPRLTIGTYPVADAYGQVQAAAARPGAVVHHLPGKALAVYSRDRPTNVYLATPGSPVQIEIFDPHPRAAIQLVLEQRVTPVG